MDDKIRESLLVRGIAAAIQSMSFPSLQNLKDLITKSGLK